MGCCVKDIWSCCCELSVCVNGTSPVWCVLYLFYYTHEKIPDFWRFELARVTHVNLPYPV